MVVVDRFDIEQVKGYTIMPNYHQRDRTLSIKAKGILSQMFSLPEGWDYTLRGLAYLNTDGIDSMRSGIRELERAGYIERRRTRDEHGKLRGTVYKVYAVPRKPTLEALTLENPTQVNPVVGIPVQAFDEMGVKKLPTVKSLQVEFADLLTAKKEAYAELKKVRDELRDLTVHKANYEELRDLEEREKRKEKEHGRE